MKIQIFNEKMYFGRQKAEKTFFCRSKREMRRRVKNELIFELSESNYVS